MKLNKRTRIYYSNCCLDEIDAAYDEMDTSIGHEQVKLLEGWVRKQKIRLKEIKYSGKVRRKPVLKWKKTDKKCSV